MGPDTWGMLGGRGVRDRNPSFVGKGWSSRSPYMDLPEAFEAKCLIIKMLSAFHLLDLKVLWLLHESPGAK